MPRPPFNEPPSAYSPAIAAALAALSAHGDGEVRGAVYAGHVVANAARLK